VIVVPCAVESRKCRLGRTGLLSRIRWDVIRGESERIQRGCWRSASAMFWRWRGPKFCAKGPEKGSEGIRRNTANDARWCGA